MIRIISIKNGVGLSRDVKIIQDLLNFHGIENEFKDARTPPERKAADVNLFIEVLNRNHFHSAKKNYLIPNPEWFFPQWLPWLSSLNKVLCKTRDAERLFSKLKCKTSFISFTSEDRMSIDKKEKSYVHLPGKSSAKGTQRIIEAFSRAGMPELKIYSQKDYPVRAKNIKLLRGEIPDIQYRKIQNENLIHLCPSTYEGFGHYINEAKSTGAVIVTTNGSPMNELVTPDFGFGCSYSSTVTSKLAEEKMVSVDSICEAVGMIEKTPVKTLLALGKKARKDFLNNDKEFKELFISEIQSQ